MVSPGIDNFLLRNSPEITRAQTVLARKFPIPDETKLLWRREIF